MNLSRTQINLSTLRQNAQFNKLVDLLKQELHDERMAYEDTEASEYQRGRVNMLKELIEQITNNQAR